MFLAKTGDGALLRPNATVVLRHKAVVRLVTVWICWARPERYSGVTTGTLSGSRYRGLGEELAEGNPVGCNLQPHWMLFDVFLVWHSRGRSKNNYKNVFVFTKYLLMNLVYKYWCHAWCSFCFIISAYRKTFHSGETSSISIWQVVTYIINPWCYVECIHLIDWPLVNKQLCHFPYRNSSNFFNDISKREKKMFNV